MLEPLDALRHRRARAAGDQDMAGGDLAAIGKPRLMGVDDGRPLFDQLGAGPRQIVAISSRRAG